MNSPYLNRVRLTRDVIRELIAARELELTRVTAAAEREQVERDLAFLRDELARRGGRE